MLPATASIPGIRETQFTRIRALLEAVARSNPFYQRKFGGLDTESIRTFADFAKLPFTTKPELVADQAQTKPYGTNLTYPVERYSRLHQTSGTTTGQPLRWLDTAESWEWIIGCWRTNFQLMGFQPGDRLFFPFSFGPFLGFWSAFDAAARSGFLCIPGGGMTSIARMQCMIDHRCTVLFATPTYSLHLAEVAAREGIDIANSSIRAIVVAGEPGGSIPATRDLIASAWGARVFDHYGLTEIGPVATEAEDLPGEMCLLENDYFVEVIEPDTGESIPDDTLGELVVTNLGRTGSPLIRYRTGDLVRMTPDGRTSSREWRKLCGGIIGRVDEMLHIRGNNVYPTAIEAIIRRYPEVAEFRLLLNRSHPLTDLCVEIEPVSGDGRALAETISRAIRDELLFRVEVVSTPPGTLPRFELKARRIVHTGS